ncbi:phage tail tape measure protein [Ochrobactrum anthropi ATCC 49188]|nr:phage tail tape measure protein [Brucella anthropi ATCC 49188]
MGRAATAYRAEVDDLAKAGFAALDNLKVPATDFGKALDAMAQAGKEGAFELRDMAQYFRRSALPIRA